MLQLGVLTNTVLAYVSVMKRCSNRIPVAFSSGESVSGKDLFEFVKVAPDSTISSVNVCYIPYELTVKINECTL